MPVLPASENIVYQKGKRAYLSKSDHGFLSEYPGFPSLGIVMGMSTEERRVGSSLHPSSQQFGIRISKESTDVCANKGQGSDIKQFRGATIPRHCLQSKGLHTVGFLQRILDSTQTAECSHPCCGESDLSAPSLN
jgi:hypothetical protein